MQVCSQMKRNLGEVGRAPSPGTSVAWHWVCPTPQRLGVGCASEALWAGCWGFAMEGSRCRQCWWITGPWWGTLLLSRRVGVRLNVLALWSSLASGASPSWREPGPSAKSHLINIPKALFHSGESQGFRSSVPATGTKTWYSLLCRRALPQSH